MSEANPADLADLDSAKRARDTINTHLLGQGNSVAGRWVAVRLSDGGSDGVLYDTKADAVRHQLHETLCAYFCIPPDGVTLRGALSFLRMNRRLYDEGMRISDPATHFSAPMREEGNTRVGIHIPGTHY